ncbi:MAG: GGDEF domain-containing protein [Campylobacterales bacterium]|nr:GGDEF domain-containing protein [Campylobacterales bacterium]
MLISEQEERERRFKLALRAALPILLLVFLVIYAIFFKNNAISLTLENQILLGAVVFISVYFIYFLIDVSIKETLVDQATQGFNQKSFIKKLNAYQPQSFALLIIDNLETLNDNYSPEEIDAMLYTFTHQLNQHFKQKKLANVLIARRYGAEFIIAFKENYKDIQSALNQIIEKNTIINDMDLDYTFSIVTNTGQDFEKTITQLKDLIHTQQSDILYEKKDKSIIKDANDISEIETTVIDALNHESIMLSFRPLLNTATNQVDIYEISVKLKSKIKQQDILPKVYLPIINRLGLGREYDLILVKHIINLLPLVPKNISFTFNLSPFSLRTKSFQEKFSTILEQNKVDPSRLIIQLYERKTHHNLGAYLDTLKHIRAKGIRICIDNFGASNASMEYMKHFKFDMVQFDRDYITNLHDQTTYSMLRSLIKMTEDLEILSVAKWVDRPEQQKTLQQLGINYLQGFGIGTSLSENELIKKYN